jgi:hypothetical protein
MKVKIGPYKIWIGPYQIAEKILFWKDKYDDESVHALGEKLASIKWLVALCEWVDSKKKRTIKVHIDDYDVWNAESTMAYVIHPALLKLKEIKHGSPFVDDEDVPEELRSTTTPVRKNEDDIDDNFHKRWDYILGEMIFAFENVNSNWEDQFWIRLPKIDTTIRSLDHGDHDFEGRKKFEERMQNGFRLFGKYYQGLWD